MKNGLENILPDKLYQYLILSGAKKSTARFHRNQLRLLLKKKVNLSLLSSAQDFITGLIERGCSGSYINNIIDTYRVFVRFARENNIPHADGLASFKFVKEHPRPRATMSDREILDFLNIPPVRKGERQKKKHDLWTLFFSIMAYSGMRCGEVAHLKGSDCDFGRGVFILADTKTNEPRVVPIAPNIVEALQKRLSEVESGLLFPSRREGGVVSNVEWQYNFQVRIKRMGLVRPNLVPYSLRHSLITRLLEEDVNMYKVQKIVGHHDIKTTAIYAHMTTKDIIAAINKHPIIRKHLDPISLIHSIEEFAVGLGIRDDKRFEFNVSQTSIYIKLK